MLNRILTLALMLSVVICCIFVFTEDPPELERTGPLPILMYHDVTDGPTSDNPMVVTTEKLEGVSLSMMCYRLGKASRT